MNGARVSLDYALARDDSRDRRDRDGERHAYDRERERERERDRGYDRDDEMRGRRHRERGHERGYERRSPGRGYERDYGPGRGYERDPDRERERNTDHWAKKEDWICDKCRNWSACRPHARLRAERASGTRLPTAPSISRGGASATSATPSRREMRGRCLRRGSCRSRARRRC